MEIQLVPESKFSFRGLRTVLVEHIDTAYPFAESREREVSYKSRNVQFNEMLVHGDW